MQIRKESSTTGDPTVRLPTSIIIVEIRPPKVGRSSWASSSHRTTSQRGMNVICPPSSSNGRLASCRPPTWNSGMQFSTWSAAVSR